MKTELVRGFNVLNLKLPRKVVRAKSYCGAPWIDVAPEGFVEIPPFRFFDRDLGVFATASPEVMFIGEPRHVGLCDAPSMLVNMREFLGLTKPVKDLPRSLRKQVQEGVGLLREGFVEMDSLENSRGLFSSHFGKMLCVFLEPTKKGRLGLVRFQGMEELVAEPAFSGHLRMWLDAEVLSRADFSAMAHASWFGLLPSDLQADILAKAF